MTTATLEPRMTQPAMVLPDAMKHLYGLTGAVRKAGLARETSTLVHLRASQINGCSFCVQMHTRELAEGGASQEKIATVAAWREAPYFTAGERIALALTETLTRLADRPEPVSDELWAEARDEYDEQELAALLIDIGTINVWNRLNTAVHQPPGEIPA